MESVPARYFPPTRTLHWLVTWKIHSPVVRHTFDLRYHKKFGIKKILGAMQIAASFGVAKVARPVWKIRKVF